MKLEDSELKNPRYSRWTPYSGAMSGAFPFHPIRRRWSEFVVWAFSNIAIRGFLVTLVS